MNVARSSRYAAYSASGMPLTMRVPKNGGSGTGLSARDRPDRAGPVARPPSGASAASRSVAVGRA